MKKSYWKNREKKTAIVNKKVLDVLNILEVIESQGGEDAYMLVDNNEENRNRLKEVGVSDGIIYKYGDDKQIWTDLYSLVW